ncbi:FecR domain-containing protein [Chitinophaga oryzae]|uniref:FecR domain-containing protein n=1 Tax=Chitinophaga oryzae TaxID=2725414 RepID=A0ABX6LE99_9BACT|nr:FecR family protein [Chitinophaga oryzae]QJB38367.1 FecR domain-containing protein [Chitinophaga oryzae]
MSTQDRLTYLLGQALQRVATAAELQELSTLIREDASGAVTQQVESRLLQELPDNTADGYDVAYWDDVAGRILAADRPEQAEVAPRVTPLRRLRWMPAAAAAVVLLAVGAYWLWKPAAPPPAAIAATPVQKDVAPGGNKAVLTLADGTELPLDSAASGALAQQGNTNILQPAGGQLVYNSSGNATVLQYNTLRTPRGGQFQVTLPDGTKVWLNAESALKYPVAFNGAVRQVELTGEAYFEVARHAAMPFKVTVRTGQQNDSMEVAVLGTQFNIMAYADEAVVKTTLLEGAVKVSSHGNSRQLAPGQGAQLDKQQDQLTFQPQANTEEAVAWKNGLMQLEGKDIASVMRMIARWYNVEVVFTAPVAAHFHGIIPRNVPVSQVLKILEMTGEVHFEIRDRQIIVSP